MCSDDVSEVEVLLYDMYSTTSYSDTEFSYPKIRELCASIINNDSMLGLIAQAGEDIVGVFFGLVHDHFFGPTLKSSDLLLYVYDNHRGGRHAYRMIKAYIEWSLSKGVARHRVCLGVTTGDKKAGMFYERLGFENCGQIYKLI
ncbi:MAG: GNAT family N-acetyltransferase [Thiotrichaceae bacterium]